MTEDNSIKNQLEDIGIDLMEGVSFDDSYCPYCEEPVATRTSNKSYELFCRFCNIVFSEH